jgi:hypothetical protein
MVSFMNEVCHSPISVECLFSMTLVNGAGVGGGGGGGQEPRVCLVRGGGGGGGGAEAGAFTRPLLSST